MALTMRTSSSESLSSARGAADAVPEDRERARLFHHRPERQRTPVEMMPSTQSTLSCCTSFWKRSIVSLGEVSSSITSSILRPAMPPRGVEPLDGPFGGVQAADAGLAAMPARGARMPMLEGLA